MEWRAYQPERDRAAVHRIWREVGWLPWKEPHIADILDGFLANDHPLVALIDGVPECCVLSQEGRLRYQQEDLPFSAITDVTTSVLAKRCGFARRLTAQGVLRGVKAGALVTGLGIFDQGFYDGLGFGTYAYNHEYTFDPAILHIDDRVRTPVRLSQQDGEEIHRLRCRRLRPHGDVYLDHACHTTRELRWYEDSYGLGYRDAPDGALSHMLWWHPEHHNGETNKLEIVFLLYETREQFLELMGLVKQQADQAILVHMMEPPGIQLQDLLVRPFRTRRLTAEGKAANNAEAFACFQMRMNDIPGCLARTRLRGQELRFNLQLTDPIASLLAEQDGWRGVAGDYVVTLGESSGAKPGRDPALPTMKTSVNVFTRLWLGVLPATALSFTKDIDAPQELLHALDATLRLPTPCTGWMF